MTHTKSSGKVDNLDTSLPRLTDKGIEMITVTLEDDYL